MLVLFVKSIIKRRLHVCIRVFEVLGRRRSKLFGADAKTRLMVDYSRPPPIPAGGLRGQCHYRLFVSHLGADLFQLSGVETDYQWVIARCVSRG